jgi:hypothetical protein
VNTCATEGLLFHTAKGSKTHGPSAWRICRAAPMADRFGPVLRMARG